MSAATHSQQQGVELYFTDADEVRALFSKLVTAPSLSKRILIFHGISGIGKTSLLRMFQLHCVNAQIPVALASGEGVKTAPDVLAEWQDDLRTAGVRMSKLTKLLKHYHTLQIRVQAKARYSAIRDMANTSLSETAGVAGGTITEALIGSVIPGAGTILGNIFGSIAGGLGAEALVDWLKSQAFTVSDIDLFLDPTNVLTREFLVDIVKVAKRRRIVLMLDTVEQIPGLSDWICDLAMRLHHNVLFVIAGQEIMHWDRQWPAWLSQSDIHVLGLMSSADIRELVNTYYSMQIGGDLAPPHVEQIAHFARGLPMAATIAVRLFSTEYREADVADIEADALDELVALLRRGVPVDVGQLLDAASVVRYFNIAILRVVTAQNDIHTAYNAMLQLPFVKSGRAGVQSVFRLHEIVRHFLHRSVRVHDPTKHTQLHQRAATYFAAQIASGDIANISRLELEWLYHQCLIDDEVGSQLFQTIAGTLAQYRLVNRLRELVNDVTTYLPAQGDCGLWRHYYSARLLQMEGQFTDAAGAYEAIRVNIDASHKVRAYALCDLGEIWTKHEYLSQPDGPKKAIHALERCLSSAPVIDAKLASIFKSLRIAYLFLGDWDRALYYLERQRQFFETSTDVSGVASTYSALKVIYGMLGDWKKALIAQNEGVQRVLSLSRSRPMMARLKAAYPWVQIWSGQYRATEESINEALYFARQTEDREMIAQHLMYLAFAQGMQGKYTASNGSFATALNTFELFAPSLVREKAILYGLWGITLVSSDVLPKAREYLDRSLKMKTSVHDTVGTVEVLVSLGWLYETLQNPATAQQYYRQALAMGQTRRNYFICAALTGLVRANTACGEPALNHGLVTEALSLAQKYEYSDLLALLSLEQGHSAWELRRPLNEPARSLREFEAALGFYKQALTFALRYNRFLLDDILIGKPGSALRPIIPYCLERGEEGKEMLRVIHDWWGVSANAIGPVENESGALMPQNIPLQAESCAREYEPGDGSTQISVLEQLERYIWR